MEWALIVLVLLCAIFFVWNISANDGNIRFISAFLLVILVVMFVASFSAYENRNTPTAMDVYQGKTTLEITYRDTIPVDSVVVFKEEFKK